MSWRLLLAFVLSFIVFALLQALFPPPRPPARPAPPGPPNAQANAPAKVAQPAEQKGPELAPAVGEKPPQAPRPQKPRKELDVRLGERFLCTADSQGACLSKVFLPEFHEAIEKKDPYQLLFPPHEDFGVFGLSLELTNGKAESPLSWNKNWDLTEVQGANFPSVVFEDKVDSLWIRKTVLPGDPSEYPAPPGSSPEEAAPRHLKVVLEFTNRSEKEQQHFHFRIYGPANIDSESQRSMGDDIELVHGFWGQGDNVYAEVLAAAKLTGGHWERGDRIAWVGMSNNYFTSILFPLSKQGPRGSYVEKAFADSFPDWQAVTALAKEKQKQPPELLPPQQLKELQEKAYKNLKVGFRSEGIILKPDETRTFEFGLYLGPREKNALDRYAALNFQGVNNYGMFGFITKFFIWLLGILKTIAFGSWGMAIILLTFLVRLCLHPINKRSQASMQRFQKKMQKVKPQMDALKERYGQNRVKLNQEIQKLFKEHGINPSQQMAGCLMIFLQLPIWWGLYYTLQYAIGLRQAGFLYITDLTRPDRLFFIPFLGEYFNLLPVLYVILTIVNQQLQPKPEDPQMLAQYRMMTVMLVFFGFIFYRFPAGFMLYIMTSSALGILESKIIKAELARDEQAGATGGAEGGAGKKNGSPEEPLAAYPARSKKAEEGRKAGRGR